MPVIQVVETYSSCDVLMIWLYCKVLNYPIRKKRHKGVFLNYLPADKFSRKLTIQIKIETRADDYT